MRSKLIKLILVLFAVSAILMPSGARSAGLSAEQQVVLEKALESRVERIVKQIAGTNDVVVTVRVTPRIPESEDSFTEAEPDMASRIARIRRGDEEEILPGVGASDLMGNNNERDSGPSESESVISLPQEFMDHMNITVLVSEDLPSELIERARNAVSNMLALDFDRGDVLEFSRTTFYVPFEKTYRYWSQFLFPHVFYLLGFILATVFLFGPVRRFLDKFVKTMEVFKVQADTRLMSSSQLEMRGGLGLENGTPGGQDMLGFNKQKALEHKKDDEESGEHFDFVTKKNIKSFIMLLKREPVDTVRMVLNYIDPALRSDVLNALDEEVKIEVMLGMGGTQEFDPQKLHQVEQKLEEKIEYLFDGKENLVSLIEEADEDLQEKLISNLERDNPDMARQVKKHIITFGDLLNLNANDLRLIITTVSQRVFVRALLSEEEEFREHIIEKFSEGPATILKQELSYIGEIPEKTIKDSRRKIISAMRRLVREDSIILTRPDDEKDESENS